MKKYDVIALGELLIDFTDYGISEQTNPVFEANPGGAPCNVLALLKKIVCFHRQNRRGPVRKNADRYSG